MNIILKKKNLCKTFGSLEYHIEPFVDEQNISIPYAKYNKVAMFPMEDSARDHDARPKHGLGKCQGRSARSNLLRFHPPLFYRKLIYLINNNNEDIQTNIIRLRDRENKIGQFHTQSLPQFLDKDNRSKSHLSAGHSSTSSIRHASEVAIHPAGCLHKDRRGCASTDDVGRYRHYHQPSCALLAGMGRVGRVQTGYGTA